METMMSERGSGRTTEQLKAAARGAIYVVPKGAIPYTRNLALHLRRDDIRLFSPEIFESARGIRGQREWDLLVLDHAAWDHMTNRQRDTYDLCRQHWSE
jgi:hypothetical protein